MTTHELAQKLLEGPDLPAQVQVNVPGDGFWGVPGDVTIEQNVAAVTLIADQAEHEEEEIVTLDFSKYRKLDQSYLSPPAYWE